MARSNQALIVGLALAFVLGACKHADQSQTKAYEQPDKLGGDICVQMRDEAIARARSESRDPQAVYREVFAREEAIFDTLMPKAQACLEKVSTGVGESDPECEGIDAERVAIYLQKQQDLGRCTTLSEGEIPEELRRGDSALCRDLAGDRPPWIDSSCNVARDGLISLGVAGIGQACDMVGNYLTDERNASAAQACGTAVIKQVCAKYAYMGLNALKVVDDATADRQEREIGGATVIGQATMRAFVNSVASCVKAYGAEKVKETIAKGVAEGAGRSAFQSLVGRAEQSLQNLDRHYVAKYLFAIACKVSTELVASGLERTSTKVYQDACSAEALAFDKQQAAACFRTGGDLCDAAILSRVDVSDIMGLEEADLQKLVADVASVGITAVCSAGGRVSGVACSTIGKSAKYIREALMEGKSNPWADCLGTPKMGACVGQSLWEVVHGVKVSDLQAPLPQFEKSAEDDSYYTVDICWCGVDCWIDRPWYQGDLKVHHQNRYYMENNPRLCAAKERTNRQVLPNPIKYQGHPLYEVINGCKVVKARSRSRHFGEGKERLLPIEVLSNGKWTTVDFEGPEYGYCGGIAR